MPESGPDRADRPRGARESARRAVFGDDDGSSASRDERDDADRARGTPTDDDRRYLDERPPHHDRG